VDVLVDLPHATATSNCLPVGDPARPVRVSRRGFLGLTFSLMPGVLSLAACGDATSGASDSSSPVEPAARPATAVAVALRLVYRNYSGAVPSAETDIPGVSSGLGYARDRFGAQNSSVAFQSDTALATFDVLPSAVSQRCVLSFWLASASVGTSGMSPVLLIDQSGQETRLEFNGVAGGRLYREGLEGFDLQVGQPGDFTDGEWHNVVIQLGPVSASLNVDGAWMSERAVNGLPLPLQKIVFGGRADSRWRGQIDDARLHDRQLTGADVAVLTYSWGRVNASNRADSIAGYYPFNGNVLNATGHGIDGVAQGAKLAPNRFGHADCAYSFDGQGSHIELDDSFDAVTDDFALCIWVRSTSSASMAVLAVTASLEGASIDVTLNDQSAIAVRMSGRPILTSGSHGLYTDGAWHFIVLQRSGATLELFVDLESRGGVRFEAAIHGSGSRVRVGRSSDDLTGTWSGQIDDLQIYDRTFTSEEMEALKFLQFMPRDGLGLLSFKGRLWLLGGWNPENIPVTNNEVWSSSDGHVWRFEGRAPWEGRHTAGWLVHENALWVLGGDRNLGHYQNEVWRSTDGVNWTLVSTTMPWADRVLFQVATLNQRMWVYGGMRIFEQVENQATFNDVYSSADGVTWHPETDSAPWSPRGMILGTPVFKDKLWVVGGGSYDVRSYCNDVWCSGDGVNWDRITAVAPWAPRQYHGVAAFHGKLWVVGGATKGNPAGQNDVWYSSDGRNWTELPDAPWEVRHALGVVADASKLWLVGGGSARLYNDTYNDTWALSFGE